MSENRDYYEVLGVDKDADARTIKRAFLKKARTVHPDVSDDPEAEAKFKELNEAYSVLSDEQKRANYDRYGTADGPGGSGYVDINDIFGGMGMDDLFSSFFGGGAGGGARNRRERRRGRDMAISLSVTLEEAALGCKKTISYDRLAPCDDCNRQGRGRDREAVQPLSRHRLCDDGPAFFPGPGSVLFALSRLPRRRHGHRSSLRDLRWPGPHAFSRKD